MWIACVPRVRYIVSANFAINDLAKAGELWQPRGTVREPSWLTTSSLPCVVRECDLVGQNDFIGQERA